MRAFLLLHHIDIHISLAPTRLIQIRKSMANDWVARRVGVANIMASFFLSFFAYYLGEGARIRSYIGGMLLRAGI
jgi:hypothetical protein